MYVPLPGTGAWRGGGETDLAVEVVPAAETVTQAEADERHRGHGERGGALARGGEHCDQRDERARHDDLDPILDEDRVDERSDEARRAAEDRGEVGLVEVTD